MDMSSSTTGQPIGDDERRAAAMARLLILLGHCQTSFLFDLADALSEQLHPHPALRIVPPARDP